MSRKNTAADATRRLAEQDEARRAYEATPILGTNIARTGDRSRDIRISGAPKNADGHPYQFPYGADCDNVVEAAAALAPTDRSEMAQYIRETAGSIREHRSTIERLHTANCRPELRLGFCH